MIDNLEEQFQLEQERLHQRATEMITKNTVEQLTKQVMEKQEQKIKHAILNGYDGIDIHYPPAHKMSFGIEGTEPWKCPPPDSDNGYLTRRYTWHWFNQERLQKAIEEDKVMELIE